jgi:predicted ester cyclase
MTGKTMVGTHTGTFLGHAATGRRISIPVTDIVRMEDNRYVEHWGSADIHGALSQMTARGTEGLRAGAGRPPGG